VIILGYPLRANNNKSAATNMIIEFQRELLKVVSKNITVHFQDERYSTLEAEKLLIEYHISKKKHKVMIHQLAAAIILQSFLDHN
jgi:putative Holliday junction resolvase